MIYLKYITGPAIGAIIGYVTNYIAVKMLFRPRKAYYIFGKKIPFTPGIIPKGKDRLANAIGEAVGKNLFTNNDLEEALVSDKVIDLITESIYKALNNDIKIEVSEKIGLENYDKYKEKTINLITEKINSAVIKLDIEGFIKNEGTKIIKENFSGGMLSMFINDDIIGKILTPVSEKIKIYIENNSYEYIKRIVIQNINDYENKSVNSIFNVNKEQLFHIIKKLYADIVRKNIPLIIEKLDISTVVKKKVNDMKVEELESLILSVMKKELKSIVNLGALIGLIIGVINIWV